VFSYSLIKQSHTTYLSLSNLETIVAISIPNRITITNFKLYNDFIKRYTECINDKISTHLGLGLRTYFCILLFCFSVVFLCVRWTSFLRRVCINPVSNLHISIPLPILNPVVPKCTSLENILHFFFINMYLLSFYN